MDAALFLRPRPCYGLEVKDGSALQIFLSEREDVCLTSGKHNGYVKVDKANKFLNLIFVLSYISGEGGFTMLKRRYILMYFEQ